MKQEICFLLKNNLLMTDHKFSFFFFFYFGRNFPWIWILLDMLAWMMFLDLNSMGKRRQKIWTELCAWHSMQLVLILFSYSVIFMIWIFLLLYCLIVAEEEKGDDNQKLFSFVYLPILKWYMTLKCTRITLLVNVYI